MAEIFITGMGMVSALGADIAENLDALQSGRSGIAALRYLQTAHKEFPVGEVKMTNEEMIRRLGIAEDSPTTRTSLMGMLAVEEALRNRPGLLTPNGLRIAFINGTTVGGMDKSEQYYIDFLENDTKNAYISTHNCGACTEMIADHFGIFSQIDTISTACSSAANAIMLGAELLKNGRADIVVAGGCECISKFHLNGFNTLMILDREPCRPFDATRAGLNLGEGAAYIVMETAETFNRGITENLDLKVYCRLAGYANTCDAFHQTASSPDGLGAYLAMKGALEKADMVPEDIDYINAHGTGTQNNDLSEGTAIDRLFGDIIPPVSSTKSFTGHTTSAAGGVEAIISILALQHNFIPSNLNFRNKIEELTFAPYCVLPSATDDSAHFTDQKLHIDSVLCNSFGFGGNDTCLIFSKI